MATVRAKARRPVGFTDLDSKSLGQGITTRHNRTRAGLGSQLQASSVSPNTQRASASTVASAGNVPVTTSGGQPYVPPSARAASGTPAAAGAGSALTAAMGGGTGPGVQPGGSGGNGTGLAYQGDPWTGFAGQYVPGKADDIFSNPGIVLQDVLRGMGIDNPAQSGYYAELEPLADVINEIMLLQNPNANAAGSPESAVNYFSNFFSQMATPGGRAPDFRTMRAVLEGADPQSALGLFLGGANDQRTQMQNYLKLGRAAAEVGLHPYYADAYNQLLAVMANDYMNQTAKGNTSQFVDFADKYDSYF